MVAISATSWILQQLLLQRHSGKIKIGEVELELELEWEAPTS